MVTEGLEVLAVCPLIIETRMIGGQEIREVSFDAGPCPVPAIRNGLGPEAHRRLVAAVLEEVDGIAAATGAVRVSFRGSPLAPASFNPKGAWYGDLLRHGY